MTVADPSEPTMRLSSIRVFVVAAALGVCAAACAQSKIVYRLVDTKGKPVVAAWLYEASFPIHYTVGSPLGGTATLMGLSNRRGRVRSYEVYVNGHVPSFLLAMARDGRIATAVTGHKIVFGPTADIKLRFLDGHGRPIAKRVVEVFPTDETFSVKGYGIDRIGFQITPKLRDRLWGQTDTNGYVRFRKLPKGQPFFVDIVTNEEMMDPVALSGAVWPGKPALIQIPLDLQISGRVVQASTGRPVPGAQVYIRFWGDWKKTFNRQVTTNANGEYRFGGLPAGEFHLKLGDPNDEQPDWVEIGDHSNIGRGDLMALRGASARCDIKVAKAGSVTLSVIDRNGNHASDWWGCDLDDPHPDQIDANYCADRLPEVYHGLEPGKHQFAVANRKLGAVLVKTIDLKEGEKAQLRIVAP